MFSVSALAAASGSDSRTLIVKTLCLIALFMHVTAHGQPAPVSDASAASAVANASEQAAKSQTISPAAPASSVNEWQAGPYTLSLLNQARLELPSEYVYIEGTQAQQLLHSLGNPNADNVRALITGLERDWLVVVRFVPAGYVSGTDTRDWDPDALLESLRRGSDSSNQKRRAQKVSELEVLGWLEQPHYDVREQMLTWSVAVRNHGEADNNQAAMNYHTFLLGREGYVSLNLITGLLQIDKNRPHLTQLLSGLEFEEGKQYSDYVRGVDRIAAFGLTALIANPSSNQPVTEEERFPVKVIIVTLVAVSLLLVLIGAGVWLLRWRKQNLPTLSEVMEEEAADETGQAGRASAAH